MSSVTQITIGWILGAILLWCLPGWANTEYTEGAALDSLTGPVDDSASVAGAEMTDRGKTVRGIYIPVGKVKTTKPKQMVRWITEMRADAVIIDVKDDLGRVVFTDQLTYATGRPHGYNRRLPKLVTKLKENGIYVIARVVCFKDNLLAYNHPEAAILDRRTAKPWRDRSNHRWADPFSQLAHDHITEVAKAAETLGVDEVQLDYVRFPVEPLTRYARYPNRPDKAPRYQAIAALLKQVDQTLNIPLSIDVFGLTAYHPEDSEALGQVLEHLAPHIDAISPMVYLANWPAHYYEEPDPEKTNAVIRGAVARIRERLGDKITVRPLLQGFKWRAENWGYSFIVNQIDASIDGGAKGYLFWNAGGRYRLLRNVWIDMDRVAPVDNDSITSR